MMAEKAIVKDDDEDQPVKDATEQHADTSTSPLGFNRQSKRKSKPATMTDRSTKFIPSSLPPSSPPSTSSQLPGSYQFPEIQPIPSDTVYQESNENDPFGFFAAERKLKQRRSTILRKPVIFDSAHSSQDHRNSIQQATFTTPKPTDTLCIPRKRTRVGQRSLMMSSPGVAHHVDEDEEPVLSTPSPTKPRMLNYDTQNDDSEKENVNVTGKRMGRKKARVEEPNELARNPGSRLPTRRTKGQKTRDTLRNAVEGDDDGDNNKARKSSGVRRGKGKAKHVSTVDVGDSDEEGEDEKQVRERQARIDYFKRLDGYKVHTEKVFVV